MDLYNELVARKESIAIVGLGYVGMPLAVAFAKKGFKVIGYDRNEKKIALYKKGIDPTNEVGDEAIKASTIFFTAEEKYLAEAKFYIIAVPTPINLDKTPDLSPVESASEVVGKYMRIGSIIVFESTVYPGVTENICVPLLEKKSNLKYGKEFNVGYSPERINPSDKVHRLENIVKIVSGDTADTMNQIAKLYETIIHAGVHKVSSIKVAEAAKVVENSQRDVNIAFMNELAMVFHRMEIDTLEVIEAMNTKWNALKFYPGLVGGHCIGVDPYYFIYEAEKLGYHSQIILSGRKINDGMSDFVVESIIKKMIQSDIKIKNSRVAILGLTFKENTPDIRNSKVIDIIFKLKEYGISVSVVDSIADKEDSLREYGIELVKLGDVNELDCVIVAVAHDYFKKLTTQDFNKMYRKSSDGNRLIIDIKGILDKKEFTDLGYSYWRL